MSDPTIASALAAIIEKTVNLALRYDPATQARLNKLQSATIAWNSTEPELTLIITIEENNIRVGTYSEDTADITLTGPLLDFISLMSQAQYSLADSNIEARGKIGLLNEFQEIVNNLDIDWEEPLTEIFGVIPGHQLAEFIRNKAEKGSTLAKALPPRVGEYLTEELRAIPTKIELNTFFDQVDTIKADVDRVGARIDALLARNTQ